MVKVFGHLNKNTMTSHTVSKACKCYHQRPVNIYIKLPIAWQRKKSNKYLLISMYRMMARNCLCIAKRKGQKTVELLYTDIKQIYFCMNYKVYTFLSRCVGIWVVWQMSVYLFNLICHPIACITKSYIYREKYRLAILMG